MKGRWVKDGETERQSESKKREEECKRRRTTSFTVLLLSSEQRREGRRGGRGGGVGSRPIFITSVLFMLLTHVWYQCMTSGPWQTAVSGKKRASGIAQPPPKINPHRPILRPQSFVLCVSFLCILMFSDLHSYLFIYLGFFWLSASFTTSCFVFPFIVSSSHSVCLSHHPHLCYPPLLCHVGGCLV